MIIILKEYDNGKFKFLESFDNSIRLKDVLEDEVDEKYYINTPDAKKFIFEQNQNDKLNKIISMPKIIQIGNLKSSLTFNNPQTGRVYSIEGLSPTLNTCQGGGGQPKVLVKNNNEYKIRKLTPKEFWRLMGFSDNAFEKVKSSKMSDTQLYKQAGNSIVTDVLYYIFKELYNAMPYLFDDLKVGSYFSGIGAFEVGLDRLYADISNNK